MGVDRIVRAGGWGVYSAGRGGEKGFGRLRRVVGDAVRGCVRATGASARGRIWHVSDSAVGMAFTCGGCFRAEGVWLSGGCSLKKKNLAIRQKTRPSRKRRKEKRKLETNKKSGGRGKENAGWAICDRNGQSHTGPNHTAPPHPTPHFLHPADPPVAPAHHPTTYPCASPGFLSKTPEHKNAQTGSISP